MLTTKKKHIGQRFLVSWQTLLSVNSSVLSVSQLCRGQIGQCKQCFSNLIKIHFSTQHQTQYIITCTQQSTYMCKQGSVLVQFIGGAICFTFRSRWIILFWWQCWTASSTCCMQLLQIQVAVECYRLPTEILSSQLHHGRSHYEQWGWTKWSPRNMIQFLAYFAIWGFTAARDNGRVGDNQTLNSLSFNGHFSRQTWVSRSYWS